MVQRKASSHLHTTRASTGTRTDLRAWPPELLAYREELRRAVHAIEDRRRIAARR
ncbi:hypothetical protein [Ramlibacter albus]|uniref:Uncharacterized protein n=1 Tax=Ramlibacter albus TaxID=2079448 RepID=A0A923M6Y1_9BURK|nr:hypothetical protein [Ramlibacter albus]MBC5765105.1 hypothetical protein [Ramlibacter albus]